MGPDVERRALIAARVLTRLNLSNLQVDCAPQQAARRQQQFASSLNAVQAVRPQAERLRYCRLDIDSQGVGFMSSAGSAVRLSAARSH